jgi:hypothetical protein
MVDLWGSTPADQPPPVRVDLWQCVSCEERGQYHVAVLAHEEGVKVDWRRALGCPLCDARRRRLRFRLCASIHRCIAVDYPVDRV